MNGVTLSRVTRDPVKRPQADPVSIPPIAARKGGVPDCRSKATITVQREIVDPTDRSIPPETITRVIPRAAMPTTEL